MTEPQPSPKRRRRRLLIRVCAVLLPIVVVFSIGESFVRYRYPVVEWYRNDIMVSSHQVEAKVFQGHLVGVFEDLTARWKEHFKKTGQTLYLPRDRCHPNATGGDTTAGWIDVALADLLPPL